MSEYELLRAAERLEKQIGSATASKRLALQPEFTRVLGRLKAEGAPVPLRMRRLEADLTDEAIEARFDNMPV